jgi:hypothetical protein
LSSRLPAGAGLCCTELLWPHFVARPPLFKVTQRKQVRFVQSEGAWRDDHPFQGPERDGCRGIVGGNAGAGEAHAIAGSPVLMNDVQEGSRLSGFRRSLVQIQAPRLVFCEGPSSLLAVGFLTCDQAFFGRCDAVQLL